MIKPIRLTYKVLWRNRKWRDSTRPCIEGESRYPSYAAAEYQVALWERKFPNNSYSIVPAELVLASE